MITLILTTLLWLGAAALAAIIGFIAYLALKKLMERISAFLKQKVGGVYVAINMRKMVEEVRAKAQREGNVMNLDALRKELEDNEGIIEAKVDENGRVIEDGIKIIKTKEMDPKLQNVLDKHNGELVLTA